MGTLKYYSISKHNPKVDVYFISVDDGKCTRHYSTDCKAGKVLVNTLDSLNILDEEKLKEQRVFQHSAFFRAVDYIFNNYEGDYKDRKYYRIGVGNVCPTDCTLYITDGSKRKEYGIESESWKAVSGIMHKLEKGTDHHTIYDNEDLYYLLNVLFKNSVNEISKGNVESLSCGYSCDCSDFGC